MLASGSSSTCEEGDGASIESEEEEAETAALGCDSCSILKEKGGN